MPLLKPADQALLREEFKNLTNPVRLIYFSQALGCDTCEITEQILQEIVPLSDKLELVTKNFAIDKDAVEQYEIKRIGLVRFLNSSRKSAWSAGLSKGILFWPFHQGVDEGCNGFP